jgi:NAD(P)-dependent dehydrogenase (short-subunit alcohol dehydrogenase family)
VRKRALVTGGSRGIGAACAIRLAREGWDVAIHYHEREEEARTVAGKASSLGARTVVLAANVGDPSQCAGLVADAVVGLGGLDAVVANAGIYDRTHLEDLTPERWARTIHVNLSGSFHVVREAVPHLRGSEGANVVLLSTQLARIGSAHGAHYASSKAAIEGLTRALALELAPFGIRVNCVAPGMTRTAILDPYSEEELAVRASKVPCRRIGEPEDLAAAVALLVSEDSSFMTGAVVHVNGGVLMA